MANDIYKAPEANLENNDINGSNSEFFIVSIKKLWIMSFFTMGLYLLHWNYAHWKSHRKSINKLGIWPAPRALFSLFFIHSLMRLIADSYRQKSGKNWSYSLYVIIYIGISVLGYAVNFLSGETPLVAIFLLFYTVIASWLLTFSVIDAQKKVNEICLDVDAETNKKITLANVFWLIVFATVWIFFVIGTVAKVMGIDLPVE